MTPISRLVNRALVAPLCVGVLTALLGSGTTGAQATQTLTTEIAPQPLSQALTAFVRQTSLQLIYVSRWRRAGAAGRTRRSARA